MTENLIGSMVSSDLKTALKDYAVPSETTDAANASGESIWYNNEAAQQLGYYKNIPEYRSVVDAKATWTIGKGLTADIDTKFILDSIIGFGKDTFNTILENIARCKEIYGDGFAEIIRDEDGSLINLKVLDNSVIGIVADERGIIIRYEQNAKVENKKTKKFRVNQIFHISRNRTADEIHGNSLSKALEWIILAKNEVMRDMRTLMHRHVIPQWKFRLMTDDPTEIAAYKAKMDATIGNGENIYEPMDVSESELISVPPNATLNPMAWLEYLNNQFYQTAGIPQIILGGSGEFTEASAKIAYLAFQQNIEEEQLLIEEQVGIQLGMEIHLTFPASIENELLSDNKKDGAQNIDASETTAGQGQ